MKFSIYHRWIIAYGEFSYYSNWIFMPQLIAANIHGYWNFSLNLIIGVNKYVGQRIYERCNSIFNNICHQC